MKLFKLFAVVFFCYQLLAFSGCKKADNAYASNNVGSPSTAYISIVHASATTGALDVALDQTRLNLPFNYTDRITYFKTYAGKRMFSVYKPVLTSTVLTKNMQFDANNNYTIFITDTSSRMDAVLIGDSNREPGPDSVRLRFANMSPDAGNINLYIQGNSAPLATNISYKTSGNFFSLKTATDVVFEIKQAGQDKVLATSAKVNLLKGNSYTIWSAGYQSIMATEGKIRVEVIRH